MKRMHTCFVFLLFNENLFMENFASSLYFVISFTSYILNLLFPFPRKEFASVGYYDDPEIIN